MSRMRWALRHPRIGLVAGSASVLAVVLLWPLGQQVVVGPATVTVATVGDMACDPADPDMDRADRCRHREVSGIALAMDPDFLLGLGDFQYELPTAKAYRTVYGPSFGRLRDRTVPVFGNQEYKVQEASSFIAYFGDRIGDARGYWSQNLGRWHLVVLNSNCSEVTGGCGTGSPQQQWLDEDLARNNRRCVIAAWHHPRWSNGIAGHDPRTADLFRTLHEHRVELVVSGHDADYERFGPLDPEGNPDERGVRQFVAGTGGQAHYRPVTPPVRPAGAYVDYDHHGVLELDLRPSSYRWRFHPLGAPVSDEGRADCY